MRFGIDLSKYQHTQPIDYKQASDFLKFVSSPHNEAYAICNDLSPYYEEDKAGFTSQGILWIAYHFADPILNVYRDEEGFRQRVGNVPGVLDLETLGLNQSDIQLQAWRNVWLSIPAERLSLDYSNLDFVNRIGIMPYHGLWYAGSDDPTTNPLTKDQAVMWQFEQITIPGISGLVDINKWVGSDTQFYTYMGFNPPTPQRGYKQAIRSIVHKFLWWIRN